MRQLFFLFLFTGFIAGVGQAQNPKAINPTDLKHFHEQVSKDAALNARVNAVAANNIQKLAMNRGNLGKVDTYFSNEVKSSGITNQKSTGRCWLFTGLNVFRARVIGEKNLPAFSFSQSFNFFYDQLEKSNLFLEGIITTANLPMDDKKVEWLFKNAIGDGGQWTGVVDIIQKYGVVPSEVYPESFNSENTQWISRLLRRKLKQDGLNLRRMHENGKAEVDLRASKKEMLAAIYKVLVVSMGEPPTEFDWRYKDNDENLSPLTHYTPKSFFDNFVNVDLNEYVMLMNDPTRPFNQLYEIEFDRHMQEGRNWKYLNLDADKIKEFAKASILGNEAMYFSCDVGKQLDKDRGYLDVNNYQYNEVFDVDFDMDKKQRIQTFESGSTHGMALVAVDIVDGKTNKWLLENSWGDTGFNGHLIMTDEWFSEYMFRLVVNKKYMGAKTLELLKKEPVMLPPWDPMFQSDN